MTAAFFRNVNPNLVAAEAKVFLLISGGRLQQLELIIGGMWVVALHTVPHSRGMNRPFYVRGIFVGVAGEAERLGSGGDQLDSGDVFDSSNFMTAGAAHRDRGMHRLCFGFIFMAGQASRWIGLRIQGDRMLRGRCVPGKTEDHEQARQRTETRPITTTGLKRLPDHRPDPPETLLHAPRRCAVSLLFTN